MCATKERASPRDRPGEGRGSRMFSITTVLAMCATIAVCFLLPAGIGAYAARREKLSILPVLWGAAGFVVPQLFFRIPVLQFLGQLPAVQTFAAQRMVLYLLLVAFSAGLVETAGRVFVFRVALRRRRMTFAAGLAAGAGHGGVEAVSLVAANYLNYLLYGLVAGLGLPVPEAVRALLAQLAAEPATTFLAAGVERVGTMLFHAALSVLICLSAARGRMLPGALIALLCHTLVDFAAAMLLSAAGWSIWAVEGVIALCGLAALLFLLRARHAFPTEAADGDLRPGAA